MRNFVEILTSTAPPTPVGSGFVLDLNDVFQQDKTSIDELLQHGIGNRDKVPMLPSITDQDRATLVLPKNAVALRCDIAYGFEVFCEGREFREVPVDKAISVSNDT